jgi:type VI secretion system secreted protein Hcp
MPIYMQIEGIEGDCTHEAHKNWTDIESINFNVTRNMNTVAGSSSSRESAEPSVSEVSITKTCDSSAARLFQEACSGQSGKRVVIHFVSTDSPGQTYLEYVLHNALIASYVVSSSGNLPTEMIALNFTKIDIKYLARDSTNKRLAQQMGSYDLATASS